MEKYDFSGYATRNDLLCSDGRTIRRDAFKHCDGQTVPLVYSHNHNDPDNILGHALLENREDGVYAYCTFNESDSAKAMKEAVRHGDVRSLSIYANKLKQAGGDVLHGFIREVSIVLAGANPGAFIDSVMLHGEDTENGLILGYDENIMVHHYTEKEVPAEAPAEVTPEAPAEASPETPAEQPEEVIQHADDKKSDNNEEETKEMAETKNTEKTVKDVFDTFTEEQKTVVYALIGQALEDAGVADDDENVEHSEGGYNDMKHNVFENDYEQAGGAFLSHEDQAEIIKMAKTGGSFKAALAAYAADHQDTLAHGFEDYTELFPDYKDVYPGAPELLERDHDWVAQVMKKAHKSPVARIRTRQADARAAEIRAKGYTNREAEKTVSADIKMIMRTTDPQTVYYRDNIHRDDVNDIDFDVVGYQKTVMKHGLEEEVAVAALLGDGRADDHADKISSENIRPIWTDTDTYTIKAVLDLAKIKTDLQGTNTGANFGENFIYTEAVVDAVMHAREKYRGKGVMDFFCTPHLLNTMLLARDMNGRRIYDSKEDLAKVLNVGNIFTVEQMEGKTRKDAEENEYKLLGLFVNMGNYTFGCAKGGEITSFEDFDIDFNTYKYLMETRLSGALTSPLSAIALEELVAAAG